MCIAILNQKNQIKDKHIKNSWDNNDQGAGMLYVRGKELLTFKTYEYKDFLAEYKKLRKDPKVKTIVLHFRIATSGFDKYVNLHPFLVNNKLGFVHNGVISGLGDQKHSDTYYFNELLKGLPENFIENGMIRELIGEYIGHSKLIFLDADNKHTIIKEHLGHWNNGNWFSNDSYKQSNDFVYYGNKKVKKTNWTIDWQNDWDFDWNKGNKEYENDYDEFLYYTNATESNLKKIASLLGITTDSKHFKSELIDLTYAYGTYDMEVIIKELQAYDTKLTTDLPLTKE